jgi:hypothetical protein
MGELVINLRGLLVGRPQFRLKSRGFHRAGTAFLAKNPYSGSKLIMFTALHLFGPAGGIPQQIQGPNLVDEVQEASLFDIGGKKLLVEAKSILMGDFLPLCEDIESDDPTGDLMGYGVEDETGELIEKSISLASEDPKEGSVVFLLGSPMYSKSLKSYRGIVREIQKEPFHVIYVDLEKIVNLWCFSGSPIVSEKGELVGILSGGDNIRGKITLDVLPTSSFHEWLKTTKEVPFNQI